MGNPKNEDDDESYEEVFNEDGDVAPPLIPRDDTYNSDSEDVNPLTFQINNKRAQRKAMSPNHKKRETQSAVYDVFTDPFYERDPEGTLPRAS